MPGISKNKRKWWHCTLSIINRDSNNVIKTFTSVDPTSPNSNLNESLVFAYSTYNANCDSPINIPVPAFDLSISPGYFLFRPSLNDLQSSIVDIITYQEAINLSKRRIFEFKRYAAYDSNDFECSSLVPNSIDTSPYETFTNSLNSNVFRFPKMPLYNQIGCCEVELSIPGVNLPSSIRSGRATSIWFLTYNELSSLYSLYSYDFARISDALVFRGNISLPSSIGKIYDITWIPLDNSLIAFCDTGIYRLFPGNESNNAIMSSNPINILNLPTENNFFPIRPELNNPLKLKIEYNYYDSFLYLFTRINDFSFSLLKLSYEFSNLRLQTATSYPQVTETDSQSEAGIQGFAFSQDSSPYTIWGNDLCQISSGLLTPVANSSSNLLSGMTTLSFAENPDSQVTENKMYSTNTAGQIFSVNPSTGVPNSLGSFIPGSPIGAATTINGEDVRIQPFPFVIGNPHWLFMVDVSSTMTGIRLPIIKSALINMLQTYVRYGNKISILWFGNNYGKITKELKTYSDSNEVINYINTYFVTPSSGKTNFCAAFSNISQDFNDLKNIIILSDGTFDDCGADWRSNINNTIRSIQSSNSGVSFTSVSVRASSGTEKLQAIATDSGGVYVNWN